MQLSAYKLKTILVARLSIFCHIIYLERGRPEPFYFKKTILSLQPLSYPNKLYLDLKSKHHIYVYYKFLFGALTELHPINLASNN